MENFEIYKNETSALSFGGSETSGYAFVKLDERYATKGFFLGEVTNTNESLQKLCNRVSEELFDNGYYKKLMKLAIEQINAGNNEELVWSGYFGLVGSELVLKICYNEKYTHVDNQFSIGNLGNSLEDLTLNMIGEFEKTAVFQIGKQHKDVKNFFLSFDKEELTTIEKVLQSIALNERFENKLNKAHKEKIVSLCRAFCMDKKEAKRDPKRKLLDVVTFKKHKLFS